jgi:uncharacterized protein DUF4236
VGFRYRKSVKLGPFRATVSKSGVSYSAGGKGVRVTKRADGRVQTTLTAPKVGVSYTASTKSRPKRAAVSSPKTSTLRKPTASRPAAVRPPKPAKVKPVRPAKPAKPLRGIRSSIMPRPPWGWPSPRVFKGGFGSVSISEHDIQLNVKRRAVSIPWREVVAVDFLEPRFARMGHVHFVTSGDPRGLDVFAREKNPATAVGKNPHAIQFSQGQRATYDELRRFIGG